MYNGVEAQQVRGTGLSGYVQRSKATVHSPITRFHPAGGADETPGEGINPLLAKRSQRENEELARRLEAHRAARAVRLRVQLYREERLEAGIAVATVTRECAELQRSLTAAVVESQEAARHADEERSSVRLAAALGVCRGEQTGSSFDRARREADRAAAEEERRRVKENQLAERLKRTRLEAEQAAARGAMS